MKLEIKPGKRYTIIGKTGSGKSVLMLKLIETYKHKPILILNSKEDPDISDLADGKKGVEVGSIAAMLSAVKKHYEYIVITPPLHELPDPVALDNYILQMYLTNKPHLFAIDELYMIHRGGRPGAGLTALLTRGRSKKMSYVGCVQRPAGVSRHVISEAEEFFIFNLTDERDKKILNEIGLDIPEKIDDYHFYHSDNDGARIFAPLPFEVKNESENETQAFNRKIFR